MQNRNAFIGAFAARLIAPQIGAMHLLLSAALCSVAARGATERNVSEVSLSDGWTADGLTVSLPHTWNAEDAADGPCGERDAHKDRRTSLELLESYSRKAVVYRRSLPDPSEGRRQFVKVDAAATVATVKVNGCVVGVHKGAFTAFCYEVTQFMKPSGNELEITVDNRRNVDVAPISGDYSMQGGLYRSVWLIETPQVCIDRTIDGGPGMELDIRMDGHVTARVHVLGGPDETHELYYPNPELWSPENPRLYEARVRIASGDEVALKFGFRTVEFRPDGFYLNGERRVIKGVNRHQDIEVKGWAMTTEDEKRDVELILEMGADAVRTAHYPQSEHIYNLFDEKGLLAWCEAPLLNGVTHSVAFEENLMDQYREMVAQLKHHPSIVMWSIYNELYENFPMPKESAEPLVERFAKWAATVDPTRPQVAASDQVPRARLNAIPHDAVAFNRYPGWYNGPVERTQELLDGIFAVNTNRTCCGISEYGGGGSILHHGDPLTRCAEGSELHTEEYQAYLHSYVYRRMIEDNRIWGTFMWVMFDFASDYRTEGDSPGINDKGMITRDRKHKKDVFWFYKANWTKEPVLHLVGKRMKQADSAKVNVLAFSNCGPVQLKVNGKSVATQAPDSVKTVLFRDVDLRPGENYVEISAGERTDGAVLNVGSKCRATCGNVEQRVEETLSRLTLVQKIGQTWQCPGRDMIEPASEDMSGEKLKESFLAGVRAGRYGSVIGKRGLKNYNALQRAAMEGVGVPLLIGSDMIHSVATTYPIPLALACSWDESLWERVAAAMAPEALLQGCNWTFTPMLDIAFDARWGRIAEGGGCDPLLTGLMGAAMIRGFQGKDMSDGFHIAACAKHYVCYGASLGGRDYNAVELSDDTLRNTYLPPFKMAVEAGVATVMPAFHSYNGVPCTMNSYLLRDILRGELGFDGMTISDCYAVNELLMHGTAADEADAAALSLNAGIDMEMVSSCYVGNLAKLIEEGRVSMKTLDDAVRNILRVKFRLGLFDHPEIDGAKVSAMVDSAANRALAREAARKSIVLLKNDADTLPLRGGAKVALLGDVAASDWQMLGCWSTKNLSNFENATLLDGLKADGVDVAYTQAYTLTGRVDKAVIETALADADVVIAAFGDYWERSGEGNSSARIELPENQLEVARAVKASGKLLVAVVFGGRPMAFSELAQIADAVVMAWNPGGCGGWGIADVLTGVAEPWGRLTVDIPRTTGACPLFYSCTTTGRPVVVDKNNPFGKHYTSCYNDVEPSALYPFGFGLTYTKFEMRNEECRIVSVAGVPQLVATVDVTNVGKRKGSELVQLYVRDEVAKIARPRRELKGFKRVELGSGETKRVEIKVPVESLGYFVNGRYVVEPGRFTVWLAPDSDSGKDICFELK